MTSPNQYFIRHQMNDTPGNNGGSFSSCPDIIFSTTGAPDWTPISTDPNTFLTAASYGTDYGSTVQVSQAGNIDNFVYLRALNTNPGVTVPTRLWMMYVESDMALWPQNWRSDEIKVGDKACNWQDGQLILSGGPGPYIVTGQPFLWSPTPPTSGNHYCVISMTEPFPGADPANSLSDPPFAPPSSIGYMSSFDQLVQFVLTNDWFGWRNTIDVSALGATWQQTIPVTGPDEGGQVYVGIACSNMPTDGFVAAYMQGPDTNNTLNIPKSPITTPNMNLTVPITLPGKFKTQMTITYWQGPTAPPYQATIAPVLTLPTDQVEILLAGRRSVRAAQYFRVLDARTNDFQQWRKMHVFGSVPLAWQTPPQPGSGMVAVPRNLPEPAPLARDAGATWQKSYPIAGPPTGAFYAGFACHQMPTDGRIAVDVIGDGSNDSVHVPPTPITSPDENFEVLVQWPPNGEGTLTLSYWQGATPPPLGASVEPLLLFPSAAQPLVGDTPPTWQQVIPIAGPEAGGEVYVGIRCENMPTDGSVAFSLDPGGIELPQTMITTSNLNVFCPYDMPPDYHGELTVYYWQGATPPPPDASISAVVEIPTGPVEAGRFHPIG